jgi:hypothetical protein
MTIRAPRRMPRQQESPCQLIPPAEMFGRPLPGRLILDAHLPFDERVARAWTWIRANRFQEDEHDRLRRVLAEVVGGKQEGVGDGC